MNYTNKNKDNKVSKNFKIRSNLLKDIFMINLFAITAPKYPLMVIRVIKTK